MIDNIVNIDGVPYRVRTVSDMSVELGQGEFEGRINYSTQEIFISDRLRDLRLLQVLRHEIAHAYLERYYHTRDSYDEEYVCELFGLFAYEISNAAQAVYNILKEDE